MSDARVKATSVTLLNNDYEFKATGSILVFDGYLKVYGMYENSEDVVLPELVTNSKLTAKEVIKEQHFTKPAPRYTESSLIKELESLGIGRPSTYATIMETIKARDYVKVEDKKFIPTNIGINTNNILQLSVPGIINVEYTASMETELDEIADEKIDNIKLLRDFYNEFEPLVEDAIRNMEKMEAEQTGESCPNCGSPLVIRNGKFGEFIACSNYPECKYIKKEEVETVEICNCPNCDGKIIEKKTKKGKIFYGCNNYPKCKTAYWDKPTGRQCPECRDMLLEKGNKIHCNSCEYEE